MLEVPELLKSGSMCCFTFGKTVESHLSGIPDNPGPVWRSDSKSQPDSKIFAGTLDDNVKHTLPKKLH